MRAHERDLQTGAIVTIDQSRHECDCSRFITPERTRRAVGGQPIQSWLLDRRSGRRTRVTNDLNSYKDLSATADGSVFPTARKDQRVGQ